MTVNVEASGSHFRDVHPVAQSYPRRSHGPGLGAALYGLRSATRASDPRRGMQRVMAPPSEIDTALVSTLWRTIPPSSCENASCASSRPPRVLFDAALSVEGLRGHAPSNHPGLQVPTPAFAVAPAGHDLLSGADALVPVPLQPDPPLVARFQSGRSPRPSPRSSRPELASTHPANRAPDDAHRCPATE